MGADCGGEGGDVGNGDIDCSGTADFKKSDDAGGCGDFTRSFVFLRS